MKKIIFCIVAMLLGINFIKIGQEFINDKTEHEVVVETSNLNISPADINNFYYVNLGDSEDEVINKIGDPVRKDLSEYGFYWYVYNQYENKYAMVGIQDSEVVALYSNAMLSSEVPNINFEKNKDYINEVYEPIEYKRKGNTKFIINSKGEYDVLKDNEKYTTVFYDLHNENKITSYQIIDLKTENDMSDIYASYNEELRESFERQMLDLTNSIRDRYDLNRLSWSDKAFSSSIKHSEDMAEENYFDHVNLKGVNPFERMKNEEIKYTLAGENLAGGQTSAIFAHEGLMNSEGHRKNILGKFKYLGVGVAFGGNYKIYYTQNFYAD